MSAKLVIVESPAKAKRSTSIARHLRQYLHEKKLTGKAALRRVAFHEITRTAVAAAIVNPRDIDQQLVDAYLARRALDYLVGFSLSPVQWQKLPGAKSAGRVQSVARRLICERESEIETFKSQECWTIEGDFAVTGLLSFRQSLTINAICRSGPNLWHLEPARPSP